MKKRTIGKWILIGAGVLFLVFVVPVIINESYKANNGYVTMWGAAEVLSYYGTVLGAFITIFALTTTIRFTKKQVQRESYLKAENEKWNKIESVIVKAIDDVSPSRASELINQSLTQSRDEAIVSFRSCMSRAETAMDMIHGYINKADEAFLQQLLSSMSRYSSKYEDVVGSLSAQFFNLEALEKVRKIHETAKTISNPFDRSEYMQKHHSLFEATKGMTVDSVTDEIISLRNQLEELRKSDYLGLLDLKRDTFATIHHHVEQDANEILNLWGK